MTLVNDSPSHRRAAQAKVSGAVRRESQLKTLLTAILILCLWRASGMSYGYPSRFDEGGSGDNVFVMKALLYSLIPLILLYALLEAGRVKQMIQKTPISVVIIFTACVASVFWSINMGASTRGLIAVSLITIAALMYRLRYGAADTWNTVYTFMVVSAIANVAYTIVFPQFAIMGGAYQGMVKGMFYHKNLMGHFFSLGFFIIFLNPQYRYGPTFHGVVKTVATACALGLVVLARSSTALMMIGVGMTVIVGLNATRALKSKPARVGLILGASVVMATLIVVSYNIVIATIAEAFGKDATLSGRSNIWDQLLPLVYDRPLFGYGFAVFRQPEVFDQFVRASWNVSSTHSTYLELCLNIGVPGAAALLFLILVRLFAKIAPSPASVPVQKQQRLEVIIILLVLVASGLDAGMLLAPIVLWPLIVISLPASFEATPVRRPLRRPVFASRGPA